MTLLPAGFFHHTDRLVVVNLSSNALETLPSDLFKKLAGLEEVVLSSNPIKVVPSDLFRRNVNLKILSWKQVSWQKFTFFTLMNLGGFEKLGTLFVLSLNSS